MSIVSHGGILTRVLVWRSMARVFIHTMECEQVVQSVEGIHEVVGGKSTKSPHVEQLVSNTISTSPLLDSINCHTSWNHGVYNSRNINKSMNHDWRINIISIINLTSHRQHEIINSSIEQLLSIEQFQSLRAYRIQNSHTHNLWLPLIPHISQLPSYRSTHPLLWPNLLWNDHYLDLGRSTTDWSLESKAPPLQRCICVRFNISLGSRSLLRTVVSSIP